MAGQIASEVWSLQATAGREQVSGNAGRGGKKIKEIARDLKISQNTFRKVLRFEETPFRSIQPQPQLRQWCETRAIDSQYGIVGRAIISQKITSTAAKAGNPKANHHLKSR